MHNSLQSILHPVKSYLRQLNDQIDRFLSAQDAYINHITTHLEQHRGKQLRPVMLFLSAGIHGKINEKTISYAMIVDLIHLSSLVHDDVIDMGKERRGNPTINAMFNNKTAVLAGDYLLVKCMHQVARCNDNKLLVIVSDTIQAMVEAELLHLRFSTDILPKQEQYLQIVESKTAVLMATCLGLGVSSVCDDDKLIDQWQTVGKAIGIAFQLKDDLFDYTSDSSSLKDTHKDIKEHKITMPLLAALENMDAAKQRFCLDLYNNHGGSTEEIQEIIRLTTASGGIKCVEEMIVRTLSPCCNFVEQQPPSPYRDAMLNLLDFLKNRNF